MIYFCSCCRKAWKQHLSPWCSVKMFQESLLSDKLLLDLLHFPFVAHCVSFCGLYLQLSPSFFQTNFKACDTTWPLKLVTILYSLSAVVLYSLTVNHSVVHTSTLFHENVSHQEFSQCRAVLYQCRGGIVVWYCIVLQNGVQRGMSVQFYDTLLKLTISWSDFHYFSMWLCRTCDKVNSSQKWGFAC